MFLQNLMHLGPALRPAPAAVRTPAAAATPDDAIRRELLQRLAQAPWWDGRTANVFVDEGVAVFQGWRGAAADRLAVYQLALATPGVCAVWDARVPRREWQALA